MSKPDDTNNNELQHDSSECGAPALLTESGINFKLLPGFADAKTYLESIGKPTDWIFKTVDPNDAGASFVKDGKPWYKSACPFYAGYWLNGGMGSVQCRAVDPLLPGLQWDKTCQHNYEKCQFYLLRRVQRNEN